MYLVPLVATIGMSTSLFVKKRWYYLAGFDFLQIEEIKQIVFYTFISEHTAIVYLHQHSDFRKNV
jgi:hypothetical protein